MDNVFYRNLNRSYLEIDRGEGIYLYDTHGNRYIDACAGAAVANLGHAHPRIIEAMVQQANKVVFSHLSRWTSAPIKELADLVAKLAPGSLNKLYLVSGGSEATEAALKMARQYFLERDGKSGKYRIISRWKSFHGNTIGALSMTGDKRRKKYVPLLLDFPHIAPAYCYRCPFEKKQENCSVECALDLERVVKMEGAENVAAFIAESVGGAACGAIVPPADYFKIIRQICDHYDILLIDDEVMAGFGRTGTMFSIEDWEVIPDLICVAKGMSAGYAPLGGVIAQEEIYNTFKQGSGSFVHGHTYGGNPLSAAVAVAVVKTLVDDGLVANSRLVGAYLLRELKEKLSPFWYVGDVRGKGMMLGVELVKDKVTKEPFLVSLGVAEKLTQTLIKHGVIVYPGTGNADGENGDQFLLAPPLTMTIQQAEELVAAMVAGFAEFEKKIAFMKY
ncbi:aspartate aminotransferase family protein [Sporomusa acidovorans]|uniref:Putrescine--pyruvate aminotransferase n=1 Tax=Sporomusa acidovorans (strain ATCC 49682 / DSM 3132 / Mol) TaxID=1123286 RepID=A0ABZ3J1Y1_SPOA4|nr:aspartate aminotransferase family protein [Sporomusa acidovorans]OZC13621.1 adenosylmethionine-8-amino-7-oxononanoate aminotransferase [Sporomusa acidovorans DSM 3132]SDE86620.1 Adenosylmethionine-8-amino-7-oxononanoate aminotransferase [Sporomusa acidovorans]